jgi:hypothetical protein
MAVISVCALNAACSGLTPTNPSSATADERDLSVLSSSARNSIHRVEEGGGGGGGQCVVAVPTDTCLGVTVTSGGVHLAGGSNIRMPVASPFDISFATDLVVPESLFPPPGNNTARFADGTIQVSIVNGVASVSLTLTGPFDSGQTFVTSGTAPAQSHSSCTGSTGTVGTVDQSITLELPHLGRTDILVRYGVVCR